MGRIDEQRRNVQVSFSCRIDCDNFCIDLCHQYVAFIEKGRTSIAISCAHGPLELDNRVQSLPLAFYEIIGSYHCIRESFSTHAQSI